MATRLYIGNLPYSADDHDLRQFFGKYSIGNIRFMTDRDTGKPRGFGFVEIEDPDAAKAAIAELDGKEMAGNDGRTRRVVVNEAKQEQRRGGGGGGGNRDGGQRRGGKGGGGKGQRRDHRDSNNGDFER